MHQIIDLRTHGLSESSSNSSLRSEIIEGLMKQELLVPGRQPGDLSFAYRKTIPTVTLYNDVGLELYDQITAVEDYYPFKTELAILQKNGLEIAHRLGGISLAASKLDLDDCLINGDKSHGGGQVPNGSSSPAKSMVSAEQTNEPSLTIIELGAGSLKKTSHLLSNVATLLQGRWTSQIRKCLSQAEYFALDLEPKQLKLTLSAIHLQKESGVGPSVGHEVQAHGICGTYNQGLDWIYKALTPDRETKDRKSQNTSVRRAIIWLGSSIGNFSPEEAVHFLSDELGRVLDKDTRVLIGIDNCQIPAKVQRAYDDSQGATRKFILNAITVIASQLGLPDGVLTSDQFEYVSRYNVEMSRNEAYLRARQDITFSIPPVKDADPKIPSPVIRIQAGELIMIERSYKFSPDEAYRMFDQAGLRVIQKWSDVPQPVAQNLQTPWSPTHTLYLLERAPFHFCRTKAWPMTLDSQVSLFDPSVARNGTKQIPHEPPSPQGCCNLENKDSSQEDISRLNYGGLLSMSDWENLWKAWDTVTLEMIPRNMLNQKPIDLRHAILFYLGHIPVFADIHISRYFNQPNTDPEWFAAIFERGIDPQIDDPQKCHDHSPFPEDSSQWPSLEEILQFRDKFRKRLKDLHDELGKTIPLTRRLGRVLTMIHEHEGMHLETLLYMLQQMSPLNPPPGFTIPDWESLAREWDLAVNLDSRKTRLIDYPNPRPITVGHDDIDEEDTHKPFSDTHEYGWDNESPVRKVVVKPFKLEAAPITNQEYLEFLFEVHSNEPFASDYIPASWVYHFDGRCGSSGEHQVKVRTIYGCISFRFAKHWPVQASGVQLEHFAKFKGGRLPTADELRVYLSDSPIDNSAQNSIGFLNWHPVPPRKPVQGNDGGWRGGFNGGVWEWTSTKFEAHPGFKPSELYPGYSQDFFDGKHHVLLGASWATIPRIACRKSVVNWYQFQYPYVFAGGRVAYDY